ncbi:MAG: sugar ABC transporter substrate-binding protein [Lentisphaerae bacterium]|nr:sugar ABC transporter substrate-binding protein [Lentisphaerota bacterium]MBT4823469.1 sugar ABC transporter substrate-binding protein [Lentisphaerota bacterium]MBT5606276.1 sugar ABC transporter substrate-binding protein [Lentisphaerota bacterium]MBT7059384.1 sugar ABC transporter substrate-binding protein [Lentisphaerota bacterium]MBT7848279.1 sugar ABC transporter substrate-binding protein [Lentisphaerota bacterium]
MMTFSGKRPDIRPGLVHGLPESSADHAAHRAWLLTLCSLLLLVTWGCRPKDRNDGKAHLVLTVPADRETRPMYRGVVKRFEEAHPNITVQILEIPANYYGKVLVMIAGRNAPDLMWMGQSFAEFAARGVFLDLSEKLETEVDLEEYLPQALSWYRVEGKQYGIPFGIDMNYIAYNKTLFDEAGVPYPTDDWDYDCFLKTAKALTRDIDGDGRIDQYGFKGELAKSSFGAQVISPDGKDVLCNRPEMIEALRTNLNLAREHHVSPLPEDSDFQGLDTYTYFRQGKAAMMQFFTWNLPFLRRQCSEMNWDIVNNPKVRQRGHWASSQAVLVSSSTRHPEEAWLLAREFFGDEVQQRMAARGLPPSRRIAEMVIQNQRKTGQKPANIAALRRASDSLYPNPRIPNLSEILSLYGSAAGGVPTGRSTPEEAMARAEKAIVLYLKRKRLRDR